MRYMMLLRADADSEAGVPPRAEVLAGVGKLMEDMASAGVLLAGEGLQPSSKGVRVTYSGGERTVIDGPFTESKELIAGFVIIDVPTITQALQWADRFARVSGDCTSEIRPLFEASDFSPETFPPEAAAREQALRDELQRKAAAR
ncbi:MAG: YciI family protein [Dehalococcoidia bacterium]